MFTYKGYTYNQYIDRDEDKLWFIHSITYRGKEGIEEVPVDYSQYCKMTETAFRLLVDLDFPARPQSRNVSVPWNEERLLEYKEELAYTKEYTINNDELTYL